MCLNACFYHTTLCVSAVHVVAWSVCPSVTFVHCIQMAEDIELLTQPGSPIVLVF